MGRTVSGKNRCPPLTACNANEDPVHQVLLSPFRLDRFEVTVGRFRKFVDAWDYRGLPEGAGGDAVVAGAGWRSSWNANLPTSKEELEGDIACRNDVYDVDRISTWTSAPAYYENLPVTCLTWYEAFAFCVWDGGRLPTEAEWEFAAANGAAGDLYPWGEAAPTATRSVYNCSYDPVPCPIIPPFPAVVGSHPGDADQWGIRDLAGNVGEWILDAVGVYPSGSVRNYANTIYGFRTTRGGAFVTTATDLRAASRASFIPGEGESALGLRCARAP
jgi:formylglycine-generating enzyme required for sulfatase activity